MAARQTPDWLLEYGLRRSFREHKSGGNLVLLLNGLDNPVQFRLLRSVATKQRAGKTNGRVGVAVSSPFRIRGGWVVMAAWGRAVFP